MSEEPRLADKKEYPILLSRQFEPEDFDDRQLRRQSESADEPGGDLDQHEKPDANT